MLNRRSLRIKAAQAIYAYQQCKASNLLNARQYITDIFKPDLTAETPLTEEELTPLREAANGILSKSLGHRSIQENHSSTEVNETAQKALELYLKDNLRDRNYLKQRMVLSAEGVRDHYVLLLLLPIEMLRLVRQENEALEAQRAKGSTALLVPETTLVGNRALLLLEKQDALEHHRIRQDLSWVEEATLVGRWYHEVIKPSEVWAAYNEIERPDFAQDVEFLLALFKRVYI